VPAFRIHAVFYDPVSKLSDTVFTGIFRTFGSIVIGKQRPVGAYAKWKRSRASKRFHRRGTQLRKVKSRLRKLFVENSVTCEVCPPFRLAAIVSGLRSLVVEAARYSKPTLDGLPIGDRFSDEPTDLIVESSIMAH